MFSCKYCEVFKKNFFYRTLLVTTSDSRVLKCFAAELFFAASGLVAWLETSFFVLLVTTDASWLPILSHFVKFILLDSKTYFINFVSHLVGFLRFWSILKCWNIFIEEPGKTSTGFLYLFKKNHNFIHTKPDASLSR